ncbi:DUF2155 domain-containing protein [Parvibaculum sp.]|uniref:DUF2155 domain-containing protein n=1 Tax=Parvibaculum sp. TaxID=2024848 RepID=UPI00272FC30A|nr:DUF2155 domain-containing protein [Parvibaculum sp.]MDP1627840.1 DUF2155 domain-containing protein [Parvibaculum sp.]MDP2150838.1 DUF2155 domain-containing protein [Parvibaculum sp.]MDP3327617.1 DUF2155 domain-containing protein [Parvibaculum sp.]
MRLLAAASLFLALSAAPAHADKYPVAVFSGLDKTTARVTSFSARVNEPARFGSLEVIVRACDKRPPEEPPQTAAFLEIRQIDREKDAVQPAPIFEGWMFAESPGLNGLEHPVYDIWVTDCKTASGGASSGSE